MERGRSIICSEQLEGMDGEELPQLLALLKNLARGFASENPLHCR